VIPFSDLAVSVEVPTRSWLDSRHPSTRTERRLVDGRNNSEAMLSQ
jgi:hypothetical protein